MSLNPADVVRRPGGGGADLPGLCAFLRRYNGNSVAAVAAYTVVAEWEGWLPEPVGPVPAGSECEIESRRRF